MVHESALGAQEININEAENSKFPSRARYSDNAAAILKLASQKAAIESKGLVGTEDILWATFASSQTTSRSNAVAQLAERGVSFEMIFGKAVLSTNAKIVFADAIKHAQATNQNIVGSEDLLWALFQRPQDCNAVAQLAERGMSKEMLYGTAELSENAKTAFAEAIKRASANNHKVVGSEDLLWALFQKTKHDSKARYWLASNRMPTPMPSVAADIKRRENAVVEEAEPEYSLSRLFCIGGLAGTFETLIQQPLVYWKTMSQVNPNFSIGAAVKAGFRPLFRGVGVNAGSIGPISAVQLAAHGGLEIGAKQVAPEHIDKPIFQLALASLSGIASCVVVTPAEVLMVTQQTTGRQFAGVFKDIMAKGGISTLFRGNAPTAFREAAWTCGFFGITPILKKALQDDSKFCRRNDVAATVISCVISGQFAATVSQPADVIASLMKADNGVYGVKKYTGVLETCGALYKESGAGGFFRGLSARSWRCVGAVFIMGEAQTALHSWFDSFGLMNKR